MRHASPRRFRYGPAASVALLALAASIAATAPDQPAPGGQLPAREQPSPEPEPMPPELTAVGSEICSACHPERVELSGEVRHLRILTREEEKGRLGGCEACHGLGSLHIETADPQAIHGSTDADKSWIADGCLPCHTKLSKADWLESDHWTAGESCNACHSNHEPETGEYLLKYDPRKGKAQHDLCLGCHKATKASFRYYSHHPVLEGRLKCSECHDLHGPAMAADIGKPVAAVCVTCHRDKEPPFVFEHEPANSDLGDGCLTCHSAHGSQNGGLLRLPGRAVCLQCHTEQAVGHMGGTCWQTGCHQQIHGSNSDPVFRQ